MAVVAVGLPVSGSAAKKLATNFYKQFSRFANDAGQLTSHLKGINFTKDVQEVVLKKGTVIQQWVGERGVGNYFTTLENGAKQNLGIGDYSDRTLKQFTVTEDTRVLQSTASDFKSNAGGGVQYFNPDLKKNIEEF